jgi:hypothetical protein
MLFQLVSVYGSFHSPLRCAELNAAVRDVLCRFRRVLNILVLTGHLELVCAVALACPLVSAFGASVDEQVFADSLPLGFGAQKLLEDVLAVDANEFELVAALCISLGKQVSPLAIVCIKEHCVFLGGTGVYFVFVGFHLSFLVLVDYALMGINNSKVNTILTQGANQKVNSAFRISGYFPLKSTNNLFGVGR